MNAKIKTKTNKDIEHAPEKYTNHLSVDINYDIKECETMKSLYLALCAILEDEFLDENGKMTSFDLHVSIERE